MSKDRCPYCKSTLCNCPRVAAAHHALQHFESVASPKRDNMLRDFFRKLLKETK